MAYPLRHTTHQITRHCYPLIAKHSSAIPEASAYPVKHHCWRAGAEKQTIEWTTDSSNIAYLVQYLHTYLAEGHGRNDEYVQINAAAKEIILQGIGVYATPQNQTGHRHTVDHHNRTGTHPRPPTDNAVPPTPAG